MALAFNKTDSAKRYPLIDDDIVFNDRRLTDDNADAMVYKNAAADARSRMNVNIGEKLADTHDQTGS